MTNQDATLVPARLGVTLRVQTLALVSLAAVGAVLRLMDLGWFPLDPREGALSLAAWQAAAGQAFGTVPGAPLFFQLQQLAFWLLHGGDAVARLVPALAGVLTILAAGGLRPLIGRSAALATAAILALGPAWVFLGRNVSPATLSVLWVLLLLGLLARGGARARTWTPVVAGLLLVSGGVAISFLIGMALSWLALRASPGGRAMLGGLAGIWPEPGQRRRAMLTLVITVLLAATGLVLRPEGFAAFVQLPMAWVAAAVNGTGPTLGLVLPLLAYAPVTLAFGLAGLVLAWRYGSFGRVLATWTLVGWLVALWAGPTTFVDLLLPLSVAAGVGVARLARSLSRHFVWREEGLMTAILLVVAAYLLLTSFAAASTAQGFEVAQRQLQLALLVLVLLVAVYWFLWGAATTLRVLGLSWLIVATIGAWSGGVALNYSSRMALTEPLRPTYVSPDGPRLVADLDNAVRLRMRDPAAMTVMADPAVQPALAWSLRDIPNVTWAVARRDIAADAVILAGVAPETPGEPAFGPAPYLGREYLISGNFVPPFLSPGALDPWLLLRWYLTREPARDLTLGGAVQLDKASLYLNVEDEVKP